LRVLRDIDCKPCRRVERAEPRGGSVPALSAPRCGISGEAGDCKIVAGRVSAFAVLLPRA